MFRDEQDLKKWWGMLYSEYCVKIMIYIYHKHNLACLFNVFFADFRLYSLVNNGVIYKSSKPTNQWLFF